MNGISYQPDSALNDINSYQYTFVNSSPADLTNVPSNNNISNNTTAPNVNQKEIIPNNTILVDPQTRIDALQRKADNEMLIEQTPKFLSLKSLGNNVSNTLLGILDDLFTKPDNIDWMNYISQILLKDDRFTFFGVFILVLAAFIYINL